MAESAKKQPTGIRCPRCWCKHWYKGRLDVRNNVNLPGRVRRYRVCRHCGYERVTIELLESDLKRLEGNVSEFD
jgi:DNA-directed RNA polymerase subunit RPC12/RpoP